MNIFAHLDRPPIRRRGWFRAAAIVACGSLALYAVNNGLILITGKPAVDVLILLGVLELACYFWVRVDSGLTVANQAIVLVLFVSLQACLFLAVRLDGFAGNGGLILAWRWTPTPEDIFEQSRRRHAKGNRSDFPSAGSWQPTAWDSPSFRGRQRNGIAPAAALATDWERVPPRPLWRQPIGGGWSSFAVVGDYAVTQEQRRDEEVVVCYELRTGREVWVYCDAVRFDEPTGGAGPRATPTIEQGRVYALGATGILNCLDAETGARLWSVDILKTNGVENRLFGMAGSPLVVDSTIVVAPGGEGSSLAAYDLAGGGLVWKGGDVASSYSSPQLVTLCGEQQILNFNADGLFAHDAATGAVVWSFPWITNPAERNNVCQPVPLSIGKGEPVDHVFIASGYGMGCAVLEIGQSDGKFSVSPRWRSRHLQAKFSSVVEYQGCVYGFDGAILACVDLKTGERRWKGGHYGYGQLLLADTCLFVQLESGAVAIVQASPERHRELARFRALDSRTWNHPVISGNLLLVRNDREAACYELPVRTDSE